MDRRGFLKNSIGALLFAGLKSNPVLSQVVDTLTPESTTKVLLYKIQNNKGFWFIRGTKWIDIAKSRINSNKYKIETFQALEVVNNDVAEKRRLFLWKENNCGGNFRGGSTGFPINIDKSIQSSVRGRKSDKMLSYYKSEQKKINSSIIGKINAQNGISQQNGKKVLELPIEKKLQMYKKSATSRVGRKADTSHKEAISKALKGKTKSEDHKRKLSINKIGKKMNEETKIKISKTISGQGNPMFGKNHSENSRKKISENHGAKVSKTCPYCGKQCPSNNYPRYHGDNCKMKNSI